MSRSSNTTSRVSSNGPAFLLLHALAISRMRGMSDGLVFDGERRAGVVDRHRVEYAEAIRWGGFDIGRRIRERHVAFLAEASRKIDVQHLNPGDRQHRIGGFLSRGDDLHDKAAPVRVRMLNRLP